MVGTHEHAVRAPCAAAWVSPSVADHAQGERSPTVRPEFTWRCLRSWVASTFDDESSSRRESAPLWCGLDVTPVRSRPQLRPPEGLTPSCTESVPMRQLLKASAVLATAALALTACGSADSGADSGDTLIVYTNSNGDGRGDWLTEQAAEAGFDIEVVGQGGGDTTNKILAEAGNPVADVVFGLNNVYFNQLVDAETIEPYTPVWANEIDAELGDASGDGNYWPVVQAGHPACLRRRQDRCGRRPERLARPLERPRLRGPLPVRDQHGQRHHPDRHVRHPHPLCRS